MEWQYTLLLIFAVFVVLIMTGMPVAFCFMLICVGGLFLLYGPPGMERLLNSIFSTLTTFQLVPVPLFILMGDIMLFSGIGPVLIHTLDKWMGRLPGRLALLSVAAGVLFATLTGTALASVAILGSVLTPEMEKQGYKKAMTLGPIMCSGSLASMIPPSALAVLLGAIGQISTGKILMAIIIPGLLLAVIFAAYIIIRCWLQPDLAPTYELKRIPLSEKLGDTFKYVVPQMIVIFLVVGVIYMGIATPSEAAATGALGALILAIAYRRWNMLITKKTLTSTLVTSAMILMILAGSNAFSQIMAITGAAGSMAAFATNLPVNPFIIIIATQVVLLILGMFIDPISIMMITLPIFVPVVEALGYDTVWFAVLFMIQIGLGGITPPFGMLLFVMKGVAPKGTTIGDCINSGLPFVGLNLLALVLILFIPEIALWLPYQMG
jgi:tripartite ATP-independent transporter DctM subunit